MSTTTESVNYQWTDYQAHVRDQLEAGEDDIVVLRIGYGGGKSRCGAQWIHRGAMDDQEGVGESVVMAQDFEKGKSTTYSVFFKTLPGERTNPFKDGDPENSPIVSNYNANDKRLTYLTGHVVWLGGADKWSRFAGGEFCRIWCDEVAHYPPQTDLYDLHRMLTTRQRTEVGPNTTLWTSTGNGFNQYYDITERQIQPDGEGGEEPLPWRDKLNVVVASTEHNTLLPEDGLEKIKRQFEGTAREEQGLHGGFAAAEGLVYDNFSRAFHVQPREMVDIRDDWRMYGYDYGWKDPRVLIEYGKTHADQYVAWDAYYESGKPVEHCINWLRENDKPAGPIYCDHDPEHIDKFRQAGYSAEAATKDLDEGISEVQEVLERDEQGRPGLIVVDELTELIQEFQSYKEDDVGTARADDHCFVAGTLVETATGPTPIEQITPGDRVLTRKGYRTVLGAGKTQEDADVLQLVTDVGHELIGTPNHPIHTPKNGFRRLDELRYGEVISTLGASVKTCRRPTRLSSVESHSAVTQTQTTRPIDGITAQAAISSRKGSKLSTGRSGNTTTARYLTDTSSTTKTTIPRITKSGISNWSITSNMPSGIPSVGSPLTTLNSELRQRKSGIDPKRVGSGTENMPGGFGRRPTRRQKTANSAGKSLNTTPRHDSARTHVRQKHAENAETTTKNESAKPASNRSLSTSTATREPVRVDAVEPWPRGRSVYNLTVEGQHEYFANGVLVHNCLDVTRYGVMGDRYVEDDKSSTTGTWGT